MNHFITNIHVNKLFHLNNFDIPIADEKHPHLIITGKNGSGKTILLNALVDFVDKVKQDTNLYFLEMPKWIQNAELRIQKADDDESLSKARMQLDSFQKSYDSFYGKVNVSFKNIAEIIKKYQDGDFIFAFYEAARKPHINEPKNPTKPNYSLKGDSKKTATDQLLNFLSDLKIQAALANNESLTRDAEEIARWFDGFEHLLQRIFKDNKLELKFNYRNYGFTICSEGKKFSFNQLSAGYAAILDIVVDLILKMQDRNSLSSVYNKEGIVFIDEVETHLHLALQKDILQILTDIFPNIQFVVTTHSPFILNSIPNAIAYDLEHRKVLSDDLTEYSYEVLAEGYFGVSTESSSAEIRLRKLEEMLSKKELSISDKNAIRQIITELDKISEAVSPDLVGEYRKVKLDHVNVIKEVLE